MKAAIVLTMRTMVAVAVINLLVPSLPFWDRVAATWLLVLLVSIPDAR